MSGSLNGWRLRTLAMCAGLVLVSALAVLAGSELIPAEHAAPDFICFWSAAKLLSSGQSPYDPAAETGVQQAYGWDKATDGIGVYEFMPYYYPPWFAMLCMLFLPLEFATAKVAWMVLLFELMLLSGYLLRHAFVGVPRGIPMTLVPAFAFSLISVRIGQTAPLILLTLVAAWQLADRRWDRAAGMVLAWVTIKPQLAGIILLGITLWAVRQRRWGIPLGFAVMLALLSLASTVLLPTWLIEMLRAPGQTPLPTDAEPWKGTTWLLLLRTLGLEDWRLWALYLPVAVALLAAVVREALNQSCTLRDLLAFATLATFFIAPYGQVYDFPVLLIPLLVMLERRLSEIWGTVVLVTVVALPYLQWFATSLDWGWLSIGDRRIIFFWVPALLTAAWFLSGLRPSGTLAAVEARSGR